MKTKHTPLPWVIAHDEQKNPCVKSGNYWIAECIPYASDDGEPSGENADFITRACNSHYDLLEALDGIMARPDFDWNIAKTAIAKAKGETP